MGKKVRKTTVVVVFLLVITSITLFYGPDILRSSSQLFFQSSVNNGAIVRPVLVGNDNSVIRYLSPVELGGSPLKPLSILASEDGTGFINVEYGVENVQIWTEIDNTGLADSELRITSVIIDTNCSEDNPNYGGAGCLSITNILGDSGDGKGDLTNKWATEISNAGGTLIIPKGEKSNMIYSNNLYLTPIELGLINFTMEINGFYINSSGDEVPLLGAGGNLVMSVLVGECSDGTTADPDSSDGDETTYCSQDSSQGGKYCRVGFNGSSILTDKSSTCGCCYYVAQDPLDTSCGYQPNGEICEEADSDGDGLLDSVDNCPNHPNANGFGTCINKAEFTPCTQDTDCHATVTGYCSMNQEDDYYPYNSNNNLGDACECTADFDCDGDVDSDDQDIFNIDIGRTDCDASSPCQGDFDCDGDVDDTWPDFDLVAYAYSQWRGTPGYPQETNPCPIRAPCTPQYCNYDPSIGEAGSTSVSGFTFTHVTFSTPFSTTPIVIATPASNNALTTDDDSGLIPTIQGITTTGFNVALCRDNGAVTCDVTMPSEEVHWIAIDPTEVSSYNWIAVGTTSSIGNTGSSHSISWGKTLSGTPRVWATPQTYSQVSGEMSMNLWVDDIGLSTTGATIIGCVHEGALDTCSGGSSTETVGWIAIDTVNQNIQGFQSGVESISNSLWTGVTFSPTYSIPIVAVLQNDDAGAQDPEYPWARSVIGSGMEIRYCEQDGRDDCDTHTGEKIVWFAVEEGPIGII